MGNNHKMTLEELMEMCVNDLKTISIPASIGADNMLNLALPIARVMHNLEIALDKAKAMKAEKEEPAEETEEEAEQEETEAPSEDP